MQLGHAVQLTGPECLVKLLSSPSRSDQRNVTLQKVVNFSVDSATAMARQPVYAVNFVRETLGPTKCVGIIVAFSVYTTVSNVDFTTVAVESTKSHASNVVVRSISSNVVNTVVVWCFGAVAPQVAAPIANNVGSRFRAAIFDR